MSALRPTTRRRSVARRQPVRATNAALVSVAIEDVSGAVGVPGAPTLRRAARAAVAAGRRGATAATLAIRIVGTREGRRLNRDYRDRDHATNVLSFPVLLPPGLPRSVTRGVLGNLVICAPVVAREARAQGKTAAAHWAHLVVHGVLHLLGHDHMRRAKAARMERLERRILADLGHPDPYLMDDR